MLLANTKSQPLASHCALVGLLAARLLKTTYPSAPSSWSNTVKWAGFLHDIGKMDATFQEFLTSHSEENDGVHLTTKKHSWSEYPRHNEVSWLLLSWLSREQCSSWVKDELHFNAMAYAVFWHHAKPLRQEDWNTSTLLLNQHCAWVPASSTSQALNTLLDDILSAAGENKTPPFVANYPSLNQPTPSFKEHYSNGTLTIEKQNTALDAEAFRTAVRACLVGADRIVSALTPEELKAHLESKGASLSWDDFNEDIAPLNNSIASMLDTFKLQPANHVRNEQQHHAAVQLNLHATSVLQGPAGCGKTKIALEWMGFNPKQTFFFVPRVAIGSHLFNEFVDDYKLTNSIELYSGEYKERYDPVQGCRRTSLQGEELTSSIVITTIDQLCSLSLSHHKIDLLSRVMNSNVVFDEFHELLDIAGISLLFLEFMRLRATTEGSGVRTLLMSATPTPYLLDFFTNCENATLHPDVGFRKPLSQRVTRVPSFNTNDFVLKLGQYQMSGIHPFTQPNVVASGDIAVSNIVSVAQEATIKALSAEQPALTYHSKYTPNDKQTVLNRVLRLFGKQATAEQPALFAGPIVQASLNISTSTLHTDATTAENFLQRMGRVNRFGLLPSGTVVMYDCTTDNGVHHRVDNVLSKFNQKNRAQEWLDYCHANKLFTTLKLSDWYDHYWKFHTLPSTQAAYKNDAAKVLAASVKLFQDNAFEPIQYFPKKISVQTKQLSKRSLRGRSFYACPRKIIHSNGKETASWLFTSTSNAEDMYSDALTFLTYSPDFLSAASEYMKSSAPSTQVHRKGLSAALFAKGSPAINPKKASLWKQRAVSPDMPIILSFDKSHARPEERIYVEYNQVIIGVMLKTNWLSCFPTSHQLTN